MPKRIMSNFWIIMHPILATSNFTELTTVQGIQIGGSCLRWQPAIDMPGIQGGSQSTYSSMTAEVAAALEGEL